MPALLAEVQRTCDEAERLAAGLARDDPDYEAVQQAVADLHALYDGLVAGGARCDDRVRATLAAIEAAWSLIDRTRDRLSTSR